MFERLYKTYNEDEVKSVIRSSEDHPDLVSDKPPSCQGSIGFWIERQAHPVKYVRMHQD